MRDSVTLQIINRDKMHEMFSYQYVHTRNAIRLTHILTLTLHPTHTHRDNRNHIRYITS
jgi:hypothetical protein